MKDFLREGEEATEEKPDDDLYPEISEMPVFNFLLEKRASWSGCLVSW